MNNNFENENVNVDSVYVDSKDMVMPGDEISTRKYNLYIGLTLLWGFVVNFLLVEFASTESLMAHPIMLIVGYIISALVGTLIYRKSSDPKISFLGYNLIVVPLGLMLNVCIAPYSSTIVLRTVTITGTVTLIMMFLGTTYPQFFAKIGRALGITLLITLLVEIVSAIFFNGSGAAIYDYIVTLVFCGYIGFDWGRANQDTKTVDNAIDSAAEIYIDIINLFLRILSIVARNSKND